MSRLADAQKELDSINAILGRGATSATVNGIRVEYNFQELRAHRDALRREIGQLSGSHPMKRRFILRT